VTIALPAALILVSELALYVGAQQFALWTHFLTLLVCSLGPLRFGDPNAEMQILALFPVFRLVNLGMPVFVEMTIYRFPLVYGPLVPATSLLASGREDVSTAAWSVTSAGTTTVSTPNSDAISSAVAARSTPIESGTATGARPRRAARARESGYARVTTSSQCGPPSSMQTGSSRDSCSS